MSASEKTSLGRDMYQQKRGTAMPSTYFALFANDLRITLLCFDDPVVALHQEYYPITPIVREPERTGIIGHCLRRPCRDSI